MTYLPSVNATGADRFEADLTAALNEASANEVASAIVRACQFVESVHYKGEDTFTKINNATSTFTRGAWWLVARAKDAEARAAERIRNELVCCNIFERVNDLREMTLAEARTSTAWHAICYWGEASARLAENRPIEGEKPNGAVRP